MSKHTPGPWRLSGELEDYVSVSVWSASGHGIGEVHPVGVTGVWTPQDIANAHLIVAAPDLLAACRVVLSFLDSLEAEAGLTPDPLIEIRREVHAPLRAALEPAIAKAEESK